MEDVNTNNTAYTNDQGRAPYGICSLTAAPMRRLRRRYDKGEHFIIPALQTGARRGVRHGMLKEGGREEKKKTDTGGKEGLKRGNKSTGNLPVGATSVSAAGAAVATQQAGRAAYLRSERKKKFKGDPQRDLGQVVDLHFSSYGTPGTQELACIGEQIVTPRNTASGGEQHLVAIFDGRKHIGLVQERAQEASRGALVVAQPDDVAGRYRVANASREVWCVETANNTEGKKSEQIWTNPGTAHQGRAPVDYSAPGQLASMGYVHYRQHRCDGCVAATTKENISSFRRCRLARRGVRHDTGGKEGSSGGTRAREISVAIITALPISGGQQRLERPVATQQAGRAAYLRSERKKKFKGDPQRDLGQVVDLHFFIIRHAGHPGTSMHRKADCDAQKHRFGWGEQHLVAIFDGRKHIGLVQSSRGALVVAQPGDVAGRYRVANASREVWCVETANNTEGKKSEQIWTNPGTAHQGRAPVDYSAPGQLASMGYVHYRQHRCDGCVAATTKENISSFRRCRLGRGAACGTVYTGGKEGLKRGNKSTGNLLAASSGWSDVGERRRSSGGNTTGGRAAYLRSERKKKFKGDPQRDLGQVVDLHFFIIRHAGHPGTSSCIGKQIVTPRNTASGGASSISWPFLMVESTLVSCSNDRGMPLGERERAQDHLAVPRSKRFREVWCVETANNTEGKKSEQIWTNPGTAHQGRAPVDYSAPGQLATPMRRLRRRYDKGEHFIIPALQTGARRGVRHGMLKEGGREWSEKKKQIREEKRGSSGGTRAREISVAIITALPISGGQQRLERPVATQQAGRAAYLRSERKKKFKGDPQRDLGQVVDLHFSSYGTPGTQGLAKHRFGWGEQHLVAIFDGRKHIGLVQSSRGALVVAQPDDVAGRYRVANASREVWCVETANNTEGKKSEQIWTNPGTAHQGRAPVDYSAPGQLASMGYVHYRQHRCDGCVAATTKENISSFRRCRLGGAACGTVYTGGKEGLKRGNKSTGNLPVGATSVSAAGAAVATQQAGRAAYLRSERKKKFKGDPQRDLGQVVDLHFFIIRHAGHPGTSSCIGEQIVTPRNTASGGASSISWPFLMVESTLVSCSNDRGMPLGERERAQEASRGALVVAQPDDVAGRYRVANASGGMVRGNGKQHRRKEERADMDKPWHRTPGPRSRGLQRTGSVGKYGICSLSAAPMRRLRRRYDKGEHFIIPALQTGDGAACGTVYTGGKEGLKRGNKSTGNLLAASSGWSDVGERRRSSGGNTTGGRAAYLRSERKKKFKGDPQRDLGQVVDLHFFIIRHAGHPGTSMHRKADCDAQKHRFGWGEQHLVAIFDGRKHIGLVQSSRGALVVAQPGDVAGRYRVANASREVWCVETANNTEGKKSEQIWTNPGTAHQGRAPVDYSAPGQLASMGYVHYRQHRCDGCVAATTKENISSFRRCRLGRGAACGTVYTGGKEGLKRGNKSTGNLPVGATSVSAAGAAVATQQAGRAAYLRSERKKKFKGDPQRDLGQVVDLHFFIIRHAGHPGSSSCIGEQIVTPRNTASGGASSISWPFLMVESTLVSCSNDRGMPLGERERAQEASRGALVVAQPDDVAGRYRVANASREVWCVETANNTEGKKSEQIWTNPGTAHQGRAPVDYSAPGQLASMGYVHYRQHRCDGCVAATTKENISSFRRCRLGRGAACGTIREEKRGSSGGTRAREISVAIITALPISGGQQRLERPVVLMQVPLYIRREEVRHVYQFSYRWPAKTAADLLRHFVVFCCWCWMLWWDSWYLVVRSAGTPAMQFDAWRGSRLSRKSRLSPTEGNEEIQIAKGGVGMGVRMEVKRGKGGQTVSNDPLSL
eukprot:gene7340-5174_t